MSLAASQAYSPARTRATPTLPALLAVVFGLFLVWGVSFANPEALHNPTHDARHALGSPCH